MAFFSAAPTNTDGSGGTAVIAAASSGNRARFLAFGISNDTASAVVVRIYDGTAAAGTLRIRQSIGTGSGFYFKIDRAGDSVFPKSWWTSGSAIEVDLDGAGTVYIYGEIVREP